MIKRILIVFFCYIGFFLNAQNYGNEWINYGQKYYAFNIVQTGLHRIDYSTLVSSGIDVQQFSSANMQVFGREKEIPLLVEDGGDGAFNNGDYFLFYAERNDGWLDYSLYENSSWIGNPKYSLYNDTIQFFFTWNNSTNNKRFVIENDVAVNSYAPSNFVLFERFGSFNEKYNEGEKSSDASSSYFMQGEGWGKTPVNGAGGFTWDFSSIQLDNLFQGSNAPLIEYNSIVVGNSNAYFANGLGNHHTRQTVGASNFVLVDSIFQGYKSIKSKSLFPSSVLSSNGSTNFKVSIIGDLSVATDFQSINFWSFKYPRIPSFNSLNANLFEIENAQNQSKVRLNLNLTGITNPILISLGTVPRKIPLINSAGQFQCLIPNNLVNEPQKMVLQDLSSVNTISALKAVNGTGTFTDFEAIPNLESALIFAYPNKLKNKALSYAAYRSSAAGGSHNVILANVDELFQQYGGGINKHINGIRRFSKNIYDLSSDKPVGLYLIGKGIREANVTSTTNLGPGSRTNSSAYQNNLVPSFGYPSCDVCITSNFEGQDKFTPLIPTGRISAQTEDELQTYLNKVIEYEAQQNQSSLYSTESKDWQKHILHFSGGSNASEQTSFQAILNSMGSIAESSYFAGDVTLVAKQNLDPITPTELQVIKERISDGVSIMNFFGHFTNSESGFDINLDEPQNWNNQGKYPILIANSCYNGNIFHNANSNSQSFVLTPNAGVIAYLGTIDYGFTSALNSYGQNFYRQFSKYNYGGTIGSHVKNVLDSVLTDNTSLITETTFCQMTLHGDPMLKVNYHNKPEIELTDSRVNFGPSNISYATDSLEVNITLRNLGKSIVDTFNVYVTRDFPGSSTDSTYILTTVGLDYEKQLQMKVPFYPSIGIGLNKFRVEVDVPSFIDEQYDELTNNQLVKSFFINIDGIEPVLPENFAVVPRDSVSLFASTINPLASFNSYRFEIDTISSFSSPFARYSLVSGNGGIKSVNPSQWKLIGNNSNAPLLLEDSVVYYWRVALVENNPIWKNRSFQYISGKSGWGQADFDQFTANQFIGINLNQSNELRQFEPIEAEISCLVKGTTQEPQILENAWYLNGFQQEYGICTFTPKLHVAIIDRATLEPWETRYLQTNSNPDNNFGNMNDNGGCRSRPERYFLFNQNNPAQMNSFQNLVENIVPNGNYILIYSPMTTRYDWWQNLNSGIVETFQGMGSDSMTYSRPNRPFIFLTRKGDPSFVVEIYSQNYEDIFLDTTISGLQGFGRESSPLIGPSSEWESIFWKHNSIDLAPSDTTKLEIQTFNQFGAYQFSIDTLLTSGDSILNLQNFVDANLYPFIKLNAKYEDNQFQTPSQMDYWHVLYAGLPESSIDANNGYVWLPGNDTLQEGQTAKFAVDIKNISDLPMDSLLVTYYVVDQNQVKHPIEYPRQDSLLPGSSLKDTITFSTNGLAGNNWFYMEVNPYIDMNQTILDQPELSHINNLLQFPFTVIDEDINPILDVTFNGKHIMNKDIIAPTSEIMITLKDENPYLVMNSDADTSLFGIYLTDPDGIQKKIPFINGTGNTVMQWIPASNQNKRFKINYPAYFEKSGEYSLLVQGTDKSGNLSGDLEYKINFEVIHESMITQMMNYPNPFSTSTRFVFTLTGDEVPDDLQIQIMTISGKVVREINEDELGPIQIGRNITEFAWDGKDAFGDPLANGVYLYRVKAKINGQEIKRLESGADDYFHKGLGKMYIIR
jgi:hypothetical protein